MAPSIESLVIALFENLNDKDENVRDAVASSLHTIGIHQPIMLLEAAHGFLASRHAKLTSGHRGALLSVMRNVCAEKLADLPDSLAALIVNLATQELTFNKEVIEEWQMPASGVLTVLCRRHCTQVMESLLQKFQPGTAPHPYVLHTLGDVAITNVFGFVLFLTDILSRTVPMLASVKQDVLRFAFVVAVKKYCESVLEYISNIDKAPDTSVKKEIFSSQFSAIYDVFSNTWLQSRDHKLRGAVVECLGELCHLLPNEKLRDEIKKLVPYMIGLLKKPADPLPVTHGLCRLLEAVIGDQACSFDIYLDDTWLALFPLLASDSDRLDTTLVRCQNEALRCFHVTAARHSDRLVYFLIQKLQTVHEKPKISSLMVLRYLINSSGPYIEDKKSLVVMALKTILNDQNNKVKKWLCHLTLALGDHGYLDVENGNLMIEFLIKQISFIEDDKKMTEAESATNKSLKYQCGQALYSLSNNVVHAEHVLWPYLFEFLCVESFTGAVADICRSLVPLAQRMNAETRLTIVYANGNERLPGPHQILARLLICLGVSDDVRTKRASSIISLLREMATFFFPSLQSSWEHELVVLANCLEEPTETKWDSAVLKFIAKTVDTVGDEEWICALAAALGKQFNLYANFVDEKNFLFKAMGGILAKVRNLQFVVDHLDLMFRNVNHARSLERSGCAHGVGYCSSSHVDIVLTKLENVAKLEYQRKSGGLLGFIKDSMPMKSENDIEIANMKATIMMSYGYVAYYCPPKMVVQKLEGTILRFLTQYFENPKDTVVKQALLHTIDLIAITVHPSHLGADCKFAAYRNTLLNYIKEYVKAESPETMTSNVRILAINAAASLSKLDPPMIESDVWAMCTVFAHNVFSINAVKLEQDSSMETEVSVNSALTALNALFEQVLLKQATAERLASLLKLLQPWFSSESAAERERSIDSAYHLLKVYYTMADVVLGHATEFSLMGSLLGRFCPRFCDSVPAIRQKALDCVHWLLAVSVIHMGHGKDYRDSVVDSVLDFKENLEKSDINAHLSVIVQIAKVLDQRLPSKQIQNYLTILFDLVLDKQDGVSAAAATLLKLQLITKGQHLVVEAEKIVSMLLARLNTLQSCLQTYAECLLALHEFAKHHLQLTLTSLLSQQLPYSQSICDCWRSLSRDQQLMPGLLEHLLDLLAVELPFDVSETSNSKLARAVPLSATAALTIVSMHVPEIVHQLFFTRILSRLLVQSGLFAGTTFARNNQNSAELIKHSSPSMIVRDAIRSLLARHAIAYEIDERNWSDFEDVLHYCDAVSGVAKAIGTNAPELIEPMVDLLKDCQQSKFEGARVVGASVYANFVKSCQTQSDDLIDTIVTALMAGLADSCLLVRKVCVRGMGYIAHCSDAVLEKYTLTVLSAMMAGLEDPTDHKDEVALEAMNGLGSLTARVSKEQIERFLVSILLRIRPCFEKTSGAVRAVAFSLFGNLARFGECEAYSEQIQSNIVSLLLHLNDEVEEVRNVCVFTLSSIGPLMQAPNVEEYFKKTLPTKNKTANMNGFSYSDFLRECAKLLVASYGERVNLYALSCANYLKSSSSRIRCNAALFIGFLLGAVPQEKRTTISKDLIFDGLVFLLKEPETEVRLSAAEAISFLYGY